MICLVPQPIDELPRSLVSQARWETIAGTIPALLAHPDWTGPAPVLLWMHGRTSRKEVDPGRYLRLIRAGIAVCAVDLPGHGERLDPGLQEPGRGLHVVRRMIDEIDPIFADLAGRPEFDTANAAIGGISAGGMATLARLCHPHEYRCAAVEATSGAWAQQRDRAMFAGVDQRLVEEIDPLSNLDGWREIPMLLLHARYDEWMALSGQSAFVEALRSRYRDPSLIELVVYERTGAAHEHVGFGRMSADAKNRQTAFLRRCLLDS